MNRSRMKWLKAILAIAASVVLVKALLITSCFIPSAGMENSLYQGEGVLVSKWSYGLRLPFPSLIGYLRLAETPVAKGDIVVFNCPVSPDADQPIESRPLYISRCVGVSGDTLMLNQELSVVKGTVFSPDAKELYVYPAQQDERLSDILNQLGLSGNSLLGYTDDGGYIRSFSHYEFYLITQKIGEYGWLTPLNKKSSEAYPFVIPAKGQLVKVYPWNVMLLCNTIRLHERREATVKGDTLYVDGLAVDSYRFSRNYYWVSSNEPVNLHDSRLFGFVPEEYLIGKAWRIWYPARLNRFWMRVQ